MVILLLTAIEVLKPASPVKNGGLAIKNTPAIIQNAINVENIEHFSSCKIKCDKINTKTIEVSERTVESATDKYFNANDSKSVPEQPIPPAI